MDENSTNNIAKELHRKAEEKLKNKELKSVKQLSLPEIENIIYEHQVQQIEMELMNEKLELKFEAEIITKMGGWEYDVLTQKATFTNSLYKIYGAIITKAEDGITYYHPDDKDLVWDSYNKAINENKPYDLQVRFINAQGENLWVRTIGRPVSENGKVVKVIGNIVDITDSKLAEEKIKESEEKYRLLFDNMESGFELNQVIVDEKNEPIDFRIIEGNKSLKNYTGYSIEEVRGKTIKQVNPNADINMIKKYGEVALTGIGFNIEYFSLTFKKYFRVITYSPQKGYFAAIFEDVSDRKQAQNTIKVSEEKYRLMVDNSGLGVGYYSIDGTILYFNQKALDYIGGKPEDYVGKSLIECFGEENGKQYLKRYNEALNSDETQEYEDCIDTVIGKKWFYSNQTVIKDANGTIKGIQVLAKDITDRKLTEENVLESEEKYRELVENSPDSIAIYEEGKLLFVNNELVKLLAAPNKEELIGKPVLQFIHPDSKELVKERMMKVALDNVTLPFIEEKALRLDGKAVDVEIKAIPIKLGGKNAVQLIIHDLTEKKLAEETIKESEEKYSLLFENMIVGFALHEIIVNDKGEPCDYRFLETNKQFEKLTGLKRKDMIGKTCLEVLPHTEQYWIDIYGKVALTGEGIDFENYSVELNKYYHVDAFSPEPGKFATVFADITDRKLAEEQVKEREQELQNIFNNLQDAYFQADINGIFTKVSPSAVRMYGYESAEEMIGMPAANLYNDAKERDELIGKLKEKHKLEDYVSIGKRKDGTTFGASLNVQFNFNEAGQIIGTNGVVRDITDRKLAEDKLRNANRLYNVLSKTNEAIVHIKEKNELYNEVCKIAVEDGNFRMAWIGEIDEDINKLVPLISAGYVNGYLDNVNIDLNDEKRSGGPTGRAAKTGEHYIAYDIANSPDMAIWKDQALQNGYFTSAAFPIKIFNKVIGAFTLYADASYSFNEEEINLLDLLAKDISNGIEFFEVDAIRHETLEALKESEEIQSLYMKHSPIYTYIKEVTSKESRVLKASDNFIDMIGVSSSDMIGKTMEELYPAEFAEKISQDDRDVVASGKMLEQEEELNGRVYITLKYPIIERGKRLLAGYTIDITKRKKAEEELKESMNDLQRFHKLTVGRELTMIELKKEVNALLKKTGQDEKYIIVE